ncbi:hypothetical protein SGFS_055010 [Streptomyces graminofaciens]|uniref:Uncharacterized protein n=1 Tax=Streptomyces graminofaciens TaxID=68212 RepID=A0ABN5VLB7_9ACTN|nr:hypothetical protein [Streptomyces graminofaciens]BBC34207.1 hypothetical protein SGFS_055010 [Streptomyces graminofaciens]
MAPPRPSAPQQPPEVVDALALNPGRRTLAVCGGIGTLQLWDASTRQPLDGPLTTSSARPGAARAAQRKSRTKARSQP